MKTAICLLAAYDTFQLEHNLMQYKDWQDIIDIYVHVDGGLLNEIEEKYGTIISYKEYLINVLGLYNIIDINHFRHSPRFSIDLVYNEIDLLTLAYNYQEQYSHYHILSESCYTYKSKSRFSNFFETHKDIDFINYWKLKNQNNDKLKRFAIPGFIGYKSDQWITLSNKTVKKIIELDFLNQIKRDYESNKIITENNYKQGAYDEIVLTSYIVNKIYNNDDVNNKADQIHLIDWYGNKTSHPYTLSLSLIILREYSVYGAKNLNHYIFCRKINAKLQSSINVVDYLRKKYGN